MNATDDKSHTPVPESGGDRAALDAEDVKKLKVDPSDKDGQLDVDIDQSFPASDPPSTTQPRKGVDGPAPGGKYD